MTLKKKTVYVFGMLLLSVAVFFSFFEKALHKNPADLPSVLTSKPLANVLLIDATAPTQKVSLREAFQGKVFVVHILASWCTVCHQEHAAWLAYAKKSRVPLVAVLYKDTPDVLTSWFQGSGNPYQRVLMDAGYAAIEWGVYGTPETFLIDQEGIVRLRLVGVMTEQRFEQELEPVVTSLVTGKPV